MTLIDPTTVHARTLDNGLRVLVRRDSSAPVVAIVTYVRAGYFDETDDVSGIAHVLEHMYFKGTPTRGVGEIARQTKAAGGYLNAATIYDHTFYYAVVPSSGFAQALDVQADAFRNSSIDRDELARELEVIIQEAKRKADNPGAVTIETLYELLHDRHRIRRWRIGREEGLRRLTRDDLMRFYRNFYTPSNTVLVIAGDVDPAMAFAEVERLYAPIPAGEPDRSPSDHETRSPGFRYRELDGDITQAQWAMGWRCPGTMHPDSPALDMVATVLGAGRASRLYRATRERKLVAGISAMNYTPRDIGVFSIQAETPAETTLAGIEATWHELRRLREEPVGTLELERARRITESRWIRRLEDMEGQATYLAEWESIGDWRLGDRYYESLMTVTPAQLNEVTRRYLSEDDVGLLVYRPTRTEPVVASAEVMRVRLDAAMAAPLDAVPVPTQAVARVTARAPTLERSEHGVHVYRMASGVPVLVRIRPNAALVHAGIFAVGGANAESAASAGRTLLMARTAVKGTERMTANQIAEASEMLGGSVGAVVGADSLGWTISVPARHAAAAMELLADVAQHPVFDAQALDTERAIALADVAALKDDMYRYPMRLALQTAFSGHPYGVPSSGTEESLRAVTRDDLIGWHARTILGAATAVGIVGSGDPVDLAAIAARHFDALAPSAVLPVPTPSWPDRVLTCMEQRDKAQTALVLLWPGPARADVTRFDLSILSGIASGLGGRLFEELRDKQSLCYTVHAGAAERLAAGTFAAYIATSPEKEAVAREGLLREIDKLRADLVSDEELRRSQTYALGVHAIRQQSGGAVLAEMVEAWLFGSLAELDEFDARVRSVTAESIRESARRYLAGDRRVEGIVRGVGRTV
jgi:zinc protease